MRHTRLKGYKTVIRNNWEVKGEVLEATGCSSSFVLNNLLRIDRELIGNRLDQRNNKYLFELPSHPLGVVADTYHTDVGGVRGADYQIKSEVQTIISIMKYRLSYQV